MHLSDSEESRQPIVMVALGGNALVRKGQSGTIEEQFENLEVPVRQIARLSSRYRIIVTHGNGPQVGHLLLQQETSSTALPRLPLEILVAQTQGQIGYMIESTLDNVFTEMGLSGLKRFVTILSYVVVDENDPAFSRPSKPIGPVFSADAAASLPYPTVETPRGFRRVVAYPLPLSIVERHEIGALLDMDFIVIACGGGGIPVIRDNRGFHGVDAVIDKDLASAVLALEVGVDFLIIATDVAGAVLSYGTRDERLLRRLSTAEAGRYAREGHFPSGSMGPKIEAAVRFLDGGGRRAVITSLDAIEAAVEGTAGTELFLSES